MRIGLLMNEKAGGLSRCDPQEIADSLEDSFASAGHDWKTTLTDGSSLKETLDDLTDWADLILVAGGDGTVAATATYLQGTDKILGILPFGTMNLVARDVGVKAWSKDLADRFARGEKRKVDVGKVNGEVFMHSVVLGAFAKIAETREAMRDDPSLLTWKDLTATISEEVLKANAEPFEIAHKTARKRLLTQSLLVSNNKIVDHSGIGLQRDRLDGGFLYLYAPADGTSVSTASVLVRLMLGRLNNTSWYRPIKARDFHVQGVEEKAMVSIDGEVRTLSMPLEFRIYPKALTIWVPAP